MVLKMLLKEASAICEPLQWAAVWWQHPPAMELDGQTGQTDLPRAAVLGCVLAAEEQVWVLLRATFCRLLLAGTDFFSVQCEGLFSVRKT